MEGNKNIVIHENFETGKILELPKEET